MRMFDELRLTVRPRRGGQGVQETVIAINGRDLGDLIRETELPHARAEGHAGLAGTYSGLPPELAFAPSKHLLGRPDALYSELVRRDTATKAAVLVCECGEPGCWPLCVRIDVAHDVVTWSDFEQPHRSAATDRSCWTYETVGPFTFERGAYESALATPGSG
jgi:hypothetical protein